MVFTSLQCIKNTYKYTFEKTTLFSKNYYNILFLYYSKYLFIFENLLTTFFYAVGKRFKKFKKISNKFKKYPLKYSINNYYFFTKYWCVLYFSICYFNVSYSILFKKKKKKFINFINQKEL